MNRWHITGMTVRSIGGTAVVRICNIHKAVPGTKDIYRSLSLSFYVKVVHS